jgi:UDP-glucose 4-epimerase
MNDPLIDVETNIRGTVVLLDECVKAGVKRVVFASSGGAIYGDQKKSNFSENDLTDPISPYAISKLAIEQYLKYYKRHFGLDYLVLRYSNPYGSNQNIAGNQGIISIFFNLVKSGERISIFGDGENRRDFIYIDDLVDATVKLYDRKTKYAIYNIGSNRGTTINQIVDLIRKITKKPILVNYLPARDVDVRDVVLDIERLKEEITDYSAISLEQGMRKTWKKINR